MTLMGRIKNSIKITPKNKQTTATKPAGRGGHDLGQMGTTGPREQADLGITLYI